MASSKMETHQQEMRPALGQPRSEPSLPEAATNDGLHQSFRRPAVTGVSCGTWWYSQAHSDHSRSHSFMLFCSTCSLTHASLSLSFTPRHNEI